MAQKLIYGRKIVIEALKSKQSIEKVLVDQGFHGEDEILIRRLCKEHDIPLKVVPTYKLDKLVSERHQGVIAMHSALQYMQLGDIIPFIYDRGEVPLILVLDRITDVRNLGAIARSAEILGAHAIVYTLKKSAEINDHTIKISAGALMHIPVCRVANMEAALNFLRHSGLTLLCSDVKADQTLAETDFTEPSAVIIGSEDYGVSREILNLSDHTFGIPQVGKTESLNASVAAGIILYHILQQRQS